MKVTIRSVDKKLWEEVQLEVKRSEFHPPRISTGQIVNEGLELRQAIKQENRDQTIAKGKP